MVTAARYFGWFVALLGGLMGLVLVSNQLLGTPEFHMNGAPVETREQALTALAICLLLLTGGLAFTRLLREQTLAGFPRMARHISWAEALPAEDPRDHWRFYTALAAPAIPLILLAPGADLPTRLGFAASVPLVAGLCWAMVWVVLGFHLINPFAWLFPPFLIFAARFFHFFAVLSCVLGAALWPFYGSEQLALGLSFAGAPGIAVASAQFLRVWLRRTGEPLAA